MSETSQTTSMSSFGINFLTVILGIVGLFSFFAPVIYTALLIFKIVDTSDWNSGNYGLSLLFMYLIFWGVLSGCISAISSLSKNGYILEDSETE